MDDYLGGLNPKKRAKALSTSVFSLTLNVSHLIDVVDRSTVSREMYATILAVLLEPHSTTHATAQFRFWAKRMFRLVTTPHANLVAHENRPVAVKDQIYHSSFSSLPPLLPSQRAAPLAFLRAHS